VYTVSMSFIFMLVHTCKLLITFLTSSGSVSCSINDYLDSVTGLKFCLSAFFLNDTK